MDRLKNMFKRIKLKDCLAPLIFLIMLIPSCIFRLKNKIGRRTLWLVAEEGASRDNGYHFYKYIRENHPDDFCYYAVKTNAPGYEKVAKLGNIIKYGSLKHWLYYMSANLNISSQKSGNPCPIFWYFIHVTLGWYKNRVFLQHGVIHNESRWVHYDKAKFKYFICGARREYEFVSSTFGYPRESIVLTGLARWDGLKDISKQQKTRSILIMPTWRNWLGGEMNKFSEIKDFKKTKYYENWSKLLNDEKFIKYIEENKINVYFYPHVNMEKFLKSFEVKSKNMKLVNCNEDIQAYLGKCDLMVTDYSSVAFDFAYLNKPVIYFQFDAREFREKQYGKGYFDFEKDGFGPVVRTPSDTVEQIIKFFDGSFETKCYANIDKFYETRYSNSSEKIYNIIKGKKAKKKVMHVVNSMNVGGIETFILNLYGNIDRDKYEFIFMTNKPGRYTYQKDVEQLGGRFIRINPTKNVGHLRHIKEVCKVIKAERPDIVHCHTYYDAASIMPVAKHLHVPVRITHSHTTEGFHLNRRALHTIMSWTIRHYSTDLVACGEEAGMALFKKRGFTVIDNGVDIDKYSFSRQTRDDIRKELDIKESDIVVGHVGRFVDVKNHKFIIDIAKQLVDIDNRYKVILVGDGVLKQEIERQVINYGIKDNVLFTGSISDTSKIYNAFDVLILPSHFEGMPMTLIEAQANGVPILASTAVTEKAKINDNFYRMNLDYGAIKWAKKIAEIRHDRAKPNEAIQKHSIRSAARSVRMVYEK